MAEEFAWNGGSEDHCAVLRGAARRITEFYDRFLKPSGLTATQFFVLVTVDAGEDVSIKKIAARFVMNRTTATRCLQSLETAGFVTMETSSKDGRALALEMTEKGARALKAAVPLWKKAQVAFEKATGPGFARDLRAALNGIQLEDGQPRGLKKTKKLARETATGTRNQRDARD
ncbi:MAG TPA: MarR family winged helix-turn-helix transcriptional regulator [Rhizomicrobium sp.]